MMDRDDQFQNWLIYMDGAIDRLLKGLPDNVRNRLDYSEHSLSLLEEHLLKQYSSVAAIRAESEMDVWDGTARYIGETFRKNFGGKWVIDYGNDKNVFYGLPQLKGMLGQRAQFCPMTLVTASLDRRTGTYLVTIFRNIQKNVQAK
jgi:hypothetical protein